MSIQVTRLHSFRGHRDCVYALQQGHAPHLFFSAGGDGMVVSWDLQSRDDGVLLAKLPNSIYSLLHLRDKELLIAAQNFSGIHLLDYQNKKEVASLQLTASYIFDMQIHGEDLIVATGDGSLIVVDIAQWTITKKLAISSKSARTMAVNSASGELAVGFSDHCIRIFGLADYRLKQELAAHENSVFTLAYSADGNFLFSGARDAHLKVWDTRAGYALSHDVVAHLYAVNHLVFSPDGKYLATGSMDKSIKVWDANSLTLLKVIDKGRHAGHGTSVNKLLWTPFNNQLVSASDDRTISDWDLLFL